ncbi:MAG: pyruvate formate lyase-activating protein [Clostridia bacterium]|nr:pyruvate formate lyase-activating protein [Clostridia bacterium]
MQGSKQNDIGRIHSFQSLGTVDGPGVRTVVFMQGCPLRCICCHNPDTWDFTGGTETTVEELTARILRYRSYFGTEGGVTVSGGEPLCQAAFVTALFRRLRELGISTALDTSGYRLDDEVRALLTVTDLVLLDYKYTNAEDHLRYTGCELSRVETFLDHLQKLGKPTWLRHVLIPGYNDSAESLARLREVRDAHSCICKVELLPFRKLCLEKYRELGIPFVLENTPEMPAARAEELAKPFKL